MSTTPTADTTTAAYLIPTAFLEASFASRPSPDDGRILRDVLRECADAAALAASGSVYTFRFDGDLDPALAAERVFVATNHPNGDRQGYRGPSVSVGDMIVVGDRVLFCDSVGFVTIPLKVAKEVVEHEFDALVSGRHGDANMGWDWLVERGVVAAD